MEAGSGASAAGRPWRKTRTRLARGEGDSNDESGEVDVDAEANGNSEAGSGTGKVGNAVRLEAASPAETAGSAGVLPAAQGAQPSTGNGHAGAHRSRHALRNAEDGEEEEEEDNGEDEEEGDTDALARRAPLRCSFCGKDFNVPSTLRVHLRTHTGERPYKCETCGRAFSQRGNLTKHMRIHEGTLPFACQTCGRMFRQRGTLTRHMAHGSCQPPEASNRAAAAAAAGLYACPHCNRQFRLSANLANHMTLYHPAVTVGSSTHDDQAGPRVSAPIIKPFLAACAVCNATIHGRVAFVQHCSQHEAEAGEVDPTGTNIVAALAERSAGIAGSVGNGDGILGGPSARMGTTINAPAAYRAPSTALGPYGMSNSVAALSQQPMAASPMLWPQQWTAPTTGLHSHGMNPMMPVGIPPAAMIPNKAGDEASNGPLAGVAGHSAAASNAAGSATLPFGSAGMPVFPHMWGTLSMDQMLYQQQWAMAQASQQALSQQQQVAASAAPHMVPAGQMAFAGNSGSAAQLQAMQAMHSMYAQQAQMHAQIKAYQERQAHGGVPAGPNDQLLQQQRQLQEQQQQQQQYIHAINQQVQQQQQQQQQQASQMQMQARARPQQGLQVAPVPVPARTTSNRQEGFHAFDSPAKDASQSQAVHANGRLLYRNPSVQQPGAVTESSAAAALMLAAANAHRQWQQQQQPRQAAASQNDVPDAQAGPSSHVQDGSESHAGN